MSVSKPLSCILSPCYLWAISISSYTVERKAKRQAEIEPDKKYIEYSEQTANLSAKIRKIAVLLSEYKVILGFGGASLCFLFFFFFCQVLV